MFPILLEKTVFLMKIDSTRLRAKHLDDVLHSATYNSALKQMVSELKAEAPIAPNEKTIETRFDQYMTQIFTELFEPLGFRYLPTKEKAVNTVRAKTKGRADTSIGNVIIEFKQPSTLHNTADQESAMQQARDYIDGFSNGEQKKTFGFVTDGLISGIYYLNDSGSFVTDYFVSLNEQQIDRLIRAVIGLGQKDLSPENLVKDFAHDKNSPAKKLAISMFDSVVNYPTEKTKMLLSEWKHLFKLSHDDISKQQAILERKQSLEKIFNEKFSDTDSEYAALFALQTSYTVLIKLVAFKVISQTKYNDSLIRFSDMVNKTPVELRDYMSELESGTIIRDYGIQNLLEGDFFSWYSTRNQWSLKMADCIDEMLIILDSYTSNNLEKTKDFFKKLYQEMIPAEVRHALGEYYTPHWLADNVINGALSTGDLENKRWRALDPTSGSGTFLTVLIEKLIEKGKDEELEKAEILNEITTRVVGIDLNPLAVLTARVNYFLNVAELIGDDTEIEIPVYSGDAAYTPTIEMIDGIEFLTYSIETELQPFNISFPKSGLLNLKKFSRTMIEIEIDIKGKNSDGIYQRLMLLINKKEQQSKTVQNYIKELSDTFVLFEANNWNGIWARIVTNYLTTSNIGKFDVVVGNPPWVDWKNLPSVYRDKIKSLPITKSIFSGDGQTGGINLNIAALITNVVATNWLAEDGVLGMLMPDTILVQRSYEGYRNLLLGDNSRAYFQKIQDWSKAGKPFYPVSQKFYTYFISRKSQDYKVGIPVIRYSKKAGVNTADELIDVNNDLLVENAKAIQSSKTATHFAILDKKTSTEDFLIVGNQFSSYKGREGIEFYPQELVLYTVAKDDRQSDTMVTVTPFKNNKSKYRLANKKSYIEKKFIRPLIKGTDIVPFHAESKYVVPFVYKQEYSMQIALPETTVRNESPKLYNLFIKSKDVFLEQNSYSKKLINGTHIPFYSFARVGAYSFAPVKVAFRDNTKNVAAVVESVSLPWGEKAEPVFQNHAVTISERPDGSYISVNEAHYICAIINSDIVIKFVDSSSDSRSFPVHPRYQIPLWSTKSSVHSLQLELSHLSQRAHKFYSDEVIISEIKQKASELYLQMLRELNADCAK